jgi:photosystem II stability/assembly factor-like uncharacterized protein
MSESMACRRAVLVGLSLAVVWPTLLLAQATSDGAGAGGLSHLRYRFIGPIGNRTSAIVGEPGNPPVVYVGAASGGIWKTEDGGTNWRPVFDHEDVAAIGALAIAPSEHNVVWAGTGEPYIIRTFMSMGDGVYRSTDGGRSWQHMGLDRTGRIARIVVDPHDPDDVYVCAVGEAYRPQHERGIFRTTDGGRTWKQVLFVNQDTGCSELAMDPGDPRTLFAGMWQVEVRTWDLDSGGPSGGVYVTHDGGDTWTKLSGHGLPAADVAVGKVAVQIAPSDPDRIYALIEEDTPRFYRSDDRGRTWTLENRSHIMAERAPYYVRFAVAPDNENQVVFVSVNMSMTLDGGRTLVPLSPAGESNHDNHDVWFDPQNGNRLLVANDQGGAMSLNRGATYRKIVLPVAQMYHVAVDDQIPYNVYGNRQDGDSFRGPSNNLADDGRITAGDWTGYGGCESAFGLPDPKDNNIVWTGCFDGQVSRMDLRTGQSRMVSPWPDPTYGWAPADVKYRWDWFAPLVISPFEHNRVYVGSQYVHMTTDGGQTWKAISPDLTTNDKTHQGNSGGVALDNPPGTYDGSILYAMAESTLQQGLIWTGSNDGQVNLTRDGGEHWTNVTKNIPDLPPWGTVMNIEPSHYDAGTAYLTVSFEQVGNYDPFVYKTTDFGKTWKPISSDLPHSPNGDARVIREDPVRKGMLYLGTDNATYISWDDGAHWTSLRLNMPPAPVYWLTIQPRYNDLVEGTYGRGFWILDDITPLRQWDSAQADDAYFFQPRDAYRYRRIFNSRAVDANSNVVGQDPPYGADMNFYLKAPAPAVIAVVDSAGDTVRTMKVDGASGLNRVWWDLHYDSAQSLQLRAPPPGQPWVAPGDNGLRPYNSYGPFRGDVIGAPGTYTIHLAVGGHQLARTLKVLPDPHSLGTVADIKAGNRFLLQIRSELGEIAGMVNRLEWARKHFQDMEPMLAEDSAHAGLLAATRAIEKEAESVENQFIDLNLTGRSEDSFRSPMRLYGKLAYLGSILMGNWGGSSADLPPTQPELQVHAELAGQLTRARQVYQTFVTSTLPAYNTRLQQSGMATGTPP